MNTEDLQSGDSSSVDNVNQDSTRDQFDESSPLKRGNANEFRFNEDEEDAFNH